MYIFTIKLSYIQLQASHWTVQNNLPRIHIKFVVERKRIFSAHINPRMFTIYSLKWVRV